MSELFDKQAFYVLLNKAYEGHLTEAEKLEFNHVIKEHDEAALTYLCFFETVSNMKNKVVLSPSYAQPFEAAQYDEWLNNLAEEEQKAPAVNISRQISKPVRTRIQKVVYPPFERYKMAGVQKLSLAACAAVIIFLAYLHFVPQLPSTVEVATLVDQLNVQWAQSSIPINNGDRLYTNEGIMDLKKGLVKIHFDSGVDVVIEGPASYEIERSGVYLEYGRLYSHVSESGRGFRVETPTSQFIDLGTEFCVQADVNGSSELHVMQGKVQFYAGSQGYAKVSQLLRKGTAVRYDAIAEQVKNISIQQNSFVRNIDSGSEFVWRGQKTLNLADVVGGGDGFGAGSQDQWIEVVQAKFFKGVQPGPKRRVGTGKYHLFKEHSFIDGVFIPNGQDGVFQVTSMGHEFAGCPVTNGLGWNGIFNSIWQVEDLKKGRSNNELMLDGIKYNSVLKPSINLHSNQGITFDLDAVRSHIQQGRISRFTAKAGISESVFENESMLFDDNGNFAYPEASFYVLVDGEVRFKELDHDCRDASLDIQMDLTPSDRFLTLIVTLGSKNSSNGDWGLFAEPFLHLE